MGKANINGQEVEMARTVSEVCEGYRTDGYQNMLTKYGTKQDSSTAFQFVPETQSDDYTLSVHYQFNGLFAKIIDLPAGEALSKGFSLNINNADVEQEIMKKWTKLGGEEAFETAVKWSRLYGGAVAVMLIYDGRGLDEPLNYKAIRGIDEIRVFEAAAVNPIFTAGYYSGEPEYYQINSLDGSFTVHASRCLLFRNGRLPQQVVDSKQRVFGFAEYDRIKTALQETITSHGYAPRMLQRAIQSIIKIKDLASLLATESGEDAVVKRLQLIDMARSMFNSIAVDADGEDFDFKSTPYTGVKEILDSSCNMLSAVTNIPQALLFGSSPQGMDATGRSDLENYYNYVQQLQKRMLRGPLEKLFGIIIKSLAATGRIDDNYDFELEFNPLWSLSDNEQAAIDQANAQAKLIKAQTAQVYVDMQALDPQEVRAALAKADEYDVETILDDVPDDELFASVIEGANDEPPAAPPPVSEEQQIDESDDTPTAAAVIVINDGKILCGVRKDNGLICGPGGHIEAGEAPIQAAIRETQEEFGITPLSLSRLGTIGINVKSADAHCTEVFACTEFSGRPKADNEEMCGALFVPRETLCEEFADSLFPPFKDSLLEFQKTELFVQLFDVEKSNNGDIIKLSEAQEDGGPGSGNFGHGGRPGKLGGSAPVSGSVGRMAQNKTWQKAKSAAEEKCKSVFPKNPECSEGTNYKGEKVGLTVQTKEAQQFYNDVSSGKLKSIEELKNDPVVQQLDSISQECTKALGGETILDESPERQQLREEIKTEFLNNGSARLDEDGNYVYDGEIKKEHKACVVIGLPAVGKSTLVDPMSQEQGMFILDNDMVKEMIPEFAATGGAAADAVHRESGIVQKNALNEFLNGNRNGDNLAIPIIGDDHQKVMDKYITVLENTGYDVEVKYVGGDPQVSCNRVVSRAVETGRIIKSNVVLDYKTKPAESYEWFKNQKGKNGKPYVREENK